MNTPQEVMNRLIDEVIIGALGVRDEQIRHMNRRLERGEQFDIPEQFKPGALIKRLSPEDRKILEVLKSSDLANGIRPSLIPH